jgi:hypothetical protein
VATDTGIVFDGQTGAKVTTLSPGESFGTIAFTTSDDGKTVLAETAGNDITLTCYDAATFAQTGSTTLAWPSGYTASKLQQLELLGQQGVAFRDDRSIFLYPTALEGVAGVRSLAESIIELKSGYPGTSSTALPRQAQSSPTPAR